MNGFMQSNNCSLCEECSGISTLQSKSLSESVLYKLCDFFLISSIVIALNLLDILIFSEFKLQGLKLTDIKFESRKLLQIISLSILIVALPFITIFITLALLYKILCSIAIKRNDRRFVKFLDSFDVFYCLQDNTTTDIQGVIHSNTIELAVDNIKKKLNNVFTNDDTNKIFYRRNEEYGFYYWRRYSFIDLAQYVQIVEVPDIHDNNMEQSLVKVESAHANQMVSYKDEGLFKVLIMMNKHGDKNEKDEYKIILKCHHSVKDAALIEFVARLVENADDCHLSLVSTRKSQDHNSPDVLMNMIKKLCHILAHSFQENVKGKSYLQDGNFIRMKPLEWTKSDENLLCKVKDVRDNLCDLNLSYILGDALARVLRKLEK